MKKANVVATASVIILFVFAAWKIAYIPDSGKTIADFDDCVNAGYPVMESYPRQCRTPEGNAFTEKISKYSGQETRLIKSLSAEDIDALEQGTGDAFGGLAKLAELNGYPGPRHVLDLATSLQLTAVQKKLVENMNNTRVTEAQVVGKEMVRLEQEMNDMFTDGTITKETLRQKLEKSSELYGQLRYIHLKYHITMLDILAPDQVKLYNKLRGYSENGDPCVNIPAGHDMEMWKKHNNCG